MKGAVVGAGALVVGLPLGLAMAGSAANAPKPGGGGNPSAYALSDIPPELLPVYQEAASKTCNMPWGVLAAIGSVESDHGRSNLPGVHDGANSAGAMGPMQFLAGTWAAYGVDGNHDGVTDVYNPVDAIWGAAAYLCANGADQPDRLRDAIWNYNHDGAYVDDVLARAQRYSEGGLGRRLPMSANSWRTPISRSATRRGATWRVAWPIRGWSRCSMPWSRTTASR